MTAAQMKKLETILAKLETLQHEVSSREAKEDMNSAKSRLIGCLMHHSMASA
jgi:hypothetical protein